MAGFSNISGDESIMFADNASFDGTERGGKLTTNGQLWIGATVSPHVRVGNITSPDGSLTVTNGAGSIQLTAAGGAAVVTKLSDDVGTVTSPTGGIIQLPSHVNNTGGKFSTTVSGSSLININPMSDFRWIVDPLGFNGTHTTLASAMTSASSGDTIGIVAGGTSGGTVLTENVTFKAGVSVFGMGDGTTPTVTINGNCTFSSAGTISLNNLRLKTNGAAFLTVAGSAASTVNLNNCYLNCSNATGISYSTASTSSQINIKFCQGDVGTTGIALYTMSSTGFIQFNDCFFTNSGSSSTASTNSAGGINFDNSVAFLVFTTSSSSGNAFVANYSKILPGGLNTIALTTSGTGSSGLHYTEVISGSASAVSLGAGTTLTSFYGQFGSTNTNAITGAGTLQYGALEFNQSGVAINTTGLTPQTVRIGTLRSQTQPAFFAYLSAATTNSTGNNATFTIVFDTEIKDQANNFNNATGVFTAPVTGMYYFSATALTTSMSASCNRATLALVISSAATNPESQIPLPLSATNISINYSGIFSLTAADTVSVTINCAGAAGNTVGVSGGANGWQTNFSGYLVC